MMADDRLDKLLSVMMEMKEEQEEMRKDIAEIKQELGNTNEKIDNLGADITLLAQKEWENERSINRIKELIL